MKLRFFKKLVHAIGDFLKGDFKHAHEYASAAVKVVALVKKAVESPVADFIVNLTPTDIDNHLLPKVKSAVKKISDEMRVVEGLAGTTNNAESILVLIHYLQTKTKDTRRRFWVDFAGKLTEYLNDGDLSYAESVALSQIVFQQLFGKESDDDDDVKESGEETPE